MSPTPRAAVVVGAVALGALVLPAALVALLVVAMLAVVAVDALSVRGAPAVDRHVPTVLARGVATTLRLDLTGAPGARVRLRQPVPPDLGLDPREATGALRATLTPLRRGRHRPPPAASRSDGPLGLGRWYHRVGDEDEVLVYPDLPAARRLVLAVRHGRFRDPGIRSRGPLGLGTEFESVRDYLPDDDIRQVNWRATARLGRPMSNQYRIEQDRDVICVVDAGRLMTAPLGDRTRLDAALDAVSAVALVVDEVGDRCGAIAFDSVVHRNVRPRRMGGDAVIKALFDLEPHSVESDYDMAFHLVGSGKRALVFVFTDLLEESAARPLVEAVPFLSRRHAVVVASSSDPDLEQLVRSEPARPSDVYAAAAAVEVLEARSRAALQIKRAGVDVIEAAPRSLGAACVVAYLRAKSRARV